MKLLIWTNMPNHYQSAFFNALRSDGIDLVVHYYLSIPENRIRLGWIAPIELPTGEQYVPAKVASIKSCVDYDERIHILPGCGRPFLFALALYCSQRGLKWLHWSEPSSPTSKWTIVRNLVRRAYASLNNKYGCGALANGDMARQDFLKWGIRPDRIRFLPYSIAPVRSVSALKRPSAITGVRFLFLGVLNARKGTDVLLDAFARVVLQYPNSRLTLVGHDTSGGKYQRSAESLGIAPQTLFLGSVPQGAVGDILATHHVLVLPSRFDGWGMVLGEAASIGLALIASDMCGAAHHLIDSGTAGYQVPAGDAQSLAETMMRFCFAPETIALHGARSRELYANFTPKKNSARLEAAVRELCHVP